AVAGLGAGAVEANYAAEVEEAGGHAAKGEGAAFDALHIGAPDGGGRSDAVDDVGELEVAVGYDRGPELSFGILYFGGGDDFGDADAGGIKVGQVGPGEIAGEDGADFGLVETGIDGFEGRHGEAEAAFAGERNVVYHQGLGGGHAGRGREQRCGQRCEG